MFSFHKPKIYRSLQGCCICRAKSSSSRFTDSKRYEDDFEKCFNIGEHRMGEICNACVLLVKRWKKLPKGSMRNWEHVVDARAGPGTKSMNKIKNKAAGLISKDPLKEERFKKKHKHKHSKKHLLLKQVQTSGLIKAPGSPSQFSDDIGDDCMSEDMQSYDADYPSASDISDDEDSRSSDRSSTAVVTKSVGRRRKATPNPLHYSSFLDLNYWKKTEICCGIIFKGANGECLLDTSLWRPCSTCKVSRSTTRTNQNKLCPSAPSRRNMEAPKGLGLPARSPPRPAAPPSRGGYLGTDPPAPVEVEPMSMLVAHTPTDSQTEMAVDGQCAAAAHLDNLTTLDNLTLPVDNLTLPVDNLTLPVDNLTLPIESPSQFQANVSPMMQESPMYIQMAV